MLNKIKDYFKKAATKIPKLNLASANMWIILTYGLACLVLVLCFIVGLVVNYYKTNSVDLKAILDMFNALTDAQVVAAVTFLAVFSVDKDKNGISDATEEKLKEMQEK